MPAFIDITGQRFERLVVTGIAGRRRSGQRFRIYWNCRCDCGTHLAIEGANLKGGNSTNCGCVRSEGLVLRNYKHGGSARRQKERLYEIWTGMLKRCRNPKAHAFKDYGGRGIKVCDEWVDDFAAFRDWALSHGYRDDLTLDRWPDNDGDYEPSNCRFATMKEQANNRRPRKRGYHRRSKYNVLLHH